MATYIYPNVRKMRECLATGHSMSSGKAARSDTRSSPYVLLARKAGHGLRLFNCWCSEPRSVKKQYVHVDLDKVRRVLTQRLSTLHT